MIHIDRYRCICVLFILYLIVYQPTAIFAVAGDEPDSLSTPVIIRKIIITGNTTTKPAIILRELTFRENDTIPRQRFTEMLNTSRQNVFNTRLFNFVTITTLDGNSAQHADVTISVIERWYIWPIPFLEISDRNFNVWWETRDFRRLTYGIDLTFFNVRGRNETLKILTHFGFNQQYGFVYKIPYLNHKQKLGTAFGVAVELNHELSVTTLRNEPVYIRSDARYLKKFVTGFADLNFRPDFFSIHTVRFSLAYYDFDSSVVAAPGFLLQKDQVQQFLTISYLYKNDRRDAVYYPLKGHCFETEVTHSIPYATAHNSFLRVNMRLYRQLQENLYWASGFTGKLSFAKQQPYYLQRGLGYGKDYVRGYEYFVIDGQHFALLKNNLKYALVPQRTAKLGFLRSEKFNRMPLALYMNAFVDAGFAYHYPQSAEGRTDDGNTLENSFLVGYGLGLDFATYYDFVVRAEFSVNRMQQPGFYLHFVAPI